MFRRKLHIEAHSEAQSKALYERNLKRKRRIVSNTRPENPHANGHRNQADPHLFAHIVPTPKT